MLNNPWVKEKVSKDIKNTQHKMKIYLQDDAKAVLKDKFKILNAYIRSLIRPFFFSKSLP